MRICLDQARFFQSGKCAIFSNGFETTSCYPNGNEFIEFGNPHAFVLEVREEGAGDVLGDVTTNAPFFLSHTATVNDASACAGGSCDAASSRHIRVFFEI